MRGNRAAWLSEPEKSRHLRQAGAAPGFGFDAIIAPRFGREDKGTGGGAPRFGAESEVTGGGRFVGMGGGEGALLLKPISKAERRGGGAMNLFATLLDTLEALVLVLLGNAGLSGDSSLAFDCLGGNVGLAGKSSQLSAEVHTIHSTILHQGYGLFRD